MTDNDKLLAWQDNGSTPGKTPPDYLNNDAAAMSLLDTLVEKGYDVRLQSFLEDPPSELWQCSMWRQMPTEQNDSCGYCIIDVYRSTRRAAVVAACLELIGKEDL